MSECLYRGTTDELDIEPTWGGVQKKCGDAKYEENRTPDTDEITKSNSVLGGLSKEDSNGLVWSGFFKYRHFKF
jgi:hypothetical protein